MILRQLTWPNIFRDGKFKQSFTHPTNINRPRDLLVAAIDLNMLTLAWCHGRDQFADALVQLIFKF